MHALMTCDLDICGDLKENVGGARITKTLRLSPKCWGRVSLLECADCRRTWLQSKSQVRSQQRD